VLATWDIRSGNRAYCARWSNFLAKVLEIYVQSSRSILCICFDHAPIFTKKRFHSCSVYFLRSSNASVAGLHVLQERVWHQKYMKQIRPKRARGQSWKIFLRNHAAEVWACDFLQVMDLFLRPLYAFSSMNSASRRVMHVNVTRPPTDLWVAHTAAGGDSVRTNDNISHSGRVSHE
jgi:hypothetical protein